MNDNASGTRFCAGMAMATSAFLKGTSPLLLIGRHHLVLDGARERSRRRAHRQG
jgi:hypothetical protein